MDNISIKHIVKAIITHTIDWRNIFPYIDNIATIKIPVRIQPAIQSRVSTIKRAVYKDLENL